MERLDEHQPKEKQVFEKGSPRPTISPGALRLNKEINSTKLFFWLVTKHNFEQHINSPHVSPLCASHNEAICVRKLLQSIPAPTCSR